MTSQLQSLTTVYDREDTEKPYLELLDGIAVRKGMPTNFHGLLIIALTLLLNKLGFKTGAEIRLLIDPEWEPVPDLVVVGRKVQNRYETTPVTVAIEVLSPGDRFSEVHAKCKRYADWGIPDVLVFDPEDRKVWAMFIIDGRTQLIELADRYQFRCKPATLELAQVWEELDRQLEG